MDSYGFHDGMLGPKPDGFRIFKVSRYDTPSAEVWNDSGPTSLFGNLSWKQSRTFWECFMKLDNLEAMEDGKDD